MEFHPLNNPIWSALTTHHAAHALGGQHARRYPPEVAPFFAVDAASEEAHEELLELLKPGEQVFVLGVSPPTHAWTIVKQIEILQMVCQEPLLEPTTDLEIAKLGPHDHASMLELTALVYPAYFREGTAQLGDYFGIHQNGTLVAMAGIRMSVDGFQEISAVCTHPDFRSRGYARRLVRRLISHIGSYGNIPFLHTEADNEVAQALYQTMGFSRRTLLPFWVLERSL